MHLDSTTARHGLPHPLAVLYARLSLHQHAPVDQLKDLLAFTEGVARFIAWVLTAEAAANGAEARLLKEWMKAKSFGAFLAVIEAGLEKRRGRSVFLPELDALRSGEAWSVFSRVRAIRNDDAHDYLPRDPVVAARHLHELAPHMQVLLDGIAFLTRHPFGVLRQAHVAHDGLTDAYWAPCRGLTIHNTQAHVRDASGVPNGQLLLLDVEGRRALTLAPFFICNSDSLCWLEIPAQEDHDRRGVYRRPASDDSLPRWVPKELFDVTGSMPDGLSFDVWLHAPEQRPRIVPLRFDTTAVARVRESSRPTQVNESAWLPAASILSINSGSTPAAPQEAVAQALIPTIAHPIAPTLSSAPPSFQVSISASPTPHSYGTPRPAPDESSPLASPYTPTLPNQGVAIPVPPPTRAPTLRWVVAAVLSLGTLAVVAVYLAVRAQHQAPVDTTAHAEVPSAPPLPPADRRLVEHPQLRAWLLRWSASVTGITSSDPVSGQSFAPEALDGFYSPVSGFHGMTNPTTDTIVNRWTQRRALNRFTIRFDSSSWLPEAPQRISSGCKRTPGNDVVLVVLDAVEEGDSVVGGSARASCHRVAGPYLLQVRQVEGLWRICNETWNFERALCASCPQISSRCPRVAPTTP